MPTVDIAFTLSDFGWQNLAELAPRVFFRPTNPGVQGSRLMPDQQILATVNPDGSGTVRLATTNDTLPSGTGYMVAVDWLPNPSIPIGHNWSDFPFPVHILPGMTSIGEVIGREVRNDMVYVAPGVVAPNIYSGFQFDPVTGDLFQRVG